MANRETDIHRKLVEKCREGDPKSQYRIYKLYSQAMYNIAIRLLANRMDAEDVLQEAFVAAFRNIGDFRESSTFGAWLRRIVINRCINFLKARQRFNADLEPDPDVLSDSEWEQADHSYDCEMIHTAVKSLPDGARAVFTLFLLEGYRHHEIAAMLDISESTSKSQYQRAKILLKEKLMHEEQIRTVSGTTA